MDQVSLRAEPRDTSGSRAARRLRRTGAVPAVVYGRGMEPVPVAVSSRDLYATLHSEAGLNALINLQVDGTEVLTVAREIQRHPVRGDITHLDFIKVSLDEPIEADVPVEYTGTPVGVSEGGGVVETILTTVSLRALPTEIPSSIEVDISALDIGDTLLVSDLPPVEGVTYLDEPDRALVTVLVPRAVEVAEEAEEEIEGVEAEGGEMPEAARTEAEEAEGSDEE